MRGQRSFLRRRFRCRRKGHLFYLHLGEDAVQVCHRCGERRAWMPEGVRRGRSFDELLEEVDAELERPYAPSSASRGRVSSGS